MMKRLGLGLQISLLPVALLVLQLGFLFPRATEEIYARGIYPHIVGAFGRLNRLSFSVAELLLLILVVLAVVALARGRAPWRRVALRIWAAAGMLTALFLALWGLNYARPSLESRLGLSEETVEAEAVLAAGRRTATLTRTLYAELETQKAPTKLPFPLDENDQRVDDLYRTLALPGDTISGRTTPAKSLSSSILFSYLGISGIFVPFTGEPSINALQPDVSLPIVIAHEKAHQRGITHEGEANFAAFLACSQPHAPVYFRYASYLFATRYLLGEASRYLPPEEVQEAWELLGDGPLEDVRAIREFWSRYEGRVSDAASRVNDGYLRALRVPGGVQSYGTVVRLLMALDGNGNLTTAEER